MINSRSSSLGVVLVMMMTMLSVTNCFQIFVEYECIGNIATLEVKSSDTIQSVKSQIKQKEGGRLLVEQQTLLLYCEQLDDEKTLADYNIEKEDILFLTYVWSEMGSNEPNPLYTVTPGLVYGGRCVNDECRHYRQLVTHHKGINTGIDVLTDVQQKRYGCPSCHHFFPLEGLRVFQCDARMWYNKCNDRQGDVKSKEFTPRRRNIIEFGARDTHGDSYQADYKSLKFDVYNIDRMAVKEEQPSRRANSQPDEQVTTECAVVWIDARRVNACVSCGHCVLCDEFGDETAADESTHWVFCDEC